MVFYETALENVFAAGRINDGYSGHTQAVQFAFIDGQTIVVADCGCFNSHLPQAVDTREALWLLEHHPSSRAHQVAPI